MVMKYACKRTTSPNMAFTKLAKMNAIRTLRECPERYMPSHIGELSRVY
jgi:hypothetical protein